MTPTQFKLKQEEGTLTVVWSDGHEFCYSLRYLRGWCPCAGCQGHFNKVKKFIDGANLDLQDLGPVGGYAVQPVWGDGHESGLYTYSYLLELEEGTPGEGPGNDACLKERA